MSLSIQPESHATTLDLLNQLPPRGRWLPDVLFLSGISNCPMLRLRRKLHAWGGLIINGLSFLVDPADRYLLGVHMVEVLHLPLNPSFVYARIMDKWVLAIGDPASIRESPLNAQFS
jgi:hypothetical protein